MNLVALYNTYTKELTSSLFFGQSKMEFSAILTSSLFFGQSKMEFSAI
jgi:hypothetical protein